MLTKKELLNYKKSKGKIIPTFINPDDPLLNEFSETLVSYFSTCHGLNRENIEQAVEQIITTFTIDPVVQKGLLKLLLIGLRLSLHMKVKFLNLETAYF